MEDLLKSDHASNGHAAKTAPPRPANEAPHPADLGPRPNVETSHPRRTGVLVAQGLGWFSVGLGLGQLLAPRAVAKLVGIKDGGGLGMRLLGARELVNGLGLLTGRRAAWWTGGRAGGDVVDAGLLVRELLRDENHRGRLIAATIAVLGVGALDAWATRQLGGDLARQEQVARVTHVGKAITVEAAPTELYKYWRNLANLSRVFPDLELVESIGADSRWVAKGPGGISVEWTAQIVEERAGELIAWRTLHGPLASSGSVRFLPAPGGRGTEVIVDMHYDLRGGVAGKLVAFAAGKTPGLELSKGLHRLKQLFELGEIMLARPEEGAR